MTDHRARQAAPRPPDPAVLTYRGVNVLAETLNGLFKAELVKLHGPWKTRAQLEFAIICWVDWYNETRLHGEIGDVPPAEYEADWYRQHNAGSQAA